MDRWAHRFVELSPELLVVLEPSGRLLHVNPAWSEALGWPLEALKARPYPSFVHPADLEAMEARLQALRGMDGRASFSCRWQDAAGAWRWLSWSVVSSAEEGLLYGTVRPLEAPPPAERPTAARKELSAFDVTQPWSMDDSLPLGLYLMETLSGRVLYANRRFLQLGGLEALEEAIRRGELTHAQVLQHWRPVSHVELLFHAPSAPGEQRPSELQESEVVLTNGRTIRRLSSPMRNPAGAAPCQLYVFEDVTERRRTEEALLRSGQGFRKLIESAPECIFVHRNQCFIYINATMLTALGYTQASELIGQPIWSIVHPDDLALVRQRVRAVVEKGEVAPLREIRYVRKDGSWFDAESTGLNVEFDGEESVVVLARDITERKRMQAQLLQSDRMALVGTMAAGVGHEINNPLSYVMANLSLALEALGPLSAEEAGAGQELKQLLEEALEGASRVRNIVRDLKSFSRQTEEQRTAVDVREALDFSIKMATNELRHRAQLIKKYEPVPPVYADVSRLGQVFLNLLMNAAQAIPEGGSATHHITVWVRHDSSGRVAVDVSDTGSGIPPEVLARIFDPFFTTRSEKAGTGLGLSICHGIISSMGGDITVRSELGRGTTFTVFLPAISVGAAVPRGRTSQTPVPLRRGRVLVIDDEPGVGRSLARVLGARHEVAVALSGQEGLERLASGAPFDAILCDLLMPDVTGMDIYERVRELRPELASRFIFITGGSYTQRSRQFLETTSNPWIEKPFEAEQLHLLLGKVIGGQ